VPRLIICGTVPPITCMMAHIIDNFAFTFTSENNFLREKTNSKGHENIRFTFWIRCRILIWSNYFVTFQL
jgi:hypothetical protein